MNTFIQSETPSDCALHSTSLASCPSSHPSLSSNSPPHDKPLHFFRSHHAALLRRLHGSPLPDGQVEAGDTRDGYGVKLFEDGRLYAGDFEGGLRSGHGVQRWPDGHVYTGLWKHDRREGEGEYRFSHGDIDGSGMIEDNECNRYHVCHTLQLQCCLPFNTASLFLEQRRHSIFTSYDNLKQLPKFQN